jgi:hypothetical protein
VPYEPIVPPGHRLGTSHDVDGAVTGHLFEDGTTGIKGHAAWRWVDEPQPACSAGCHCEEPQRLTPEERELAIRLAAVAVTAIVRVAAPHLRRWWRERAVPAVASIRKRAGAASKADPHAEDAASLSLSHAVTSSGVEVPVAEPEFSMTSAEWMERFRAMLAAGAFHEEQRRIILKARIEDGDGSGAAGAVAERLTPQQFADRIVATLFANRSLLTPEISAELTRLFGEASDGRHRPALER